MIGAVRTDGAWLVGSGPRWSRAREVTMAAATSLKVQSTSEIAIAWRALLVGEGTGEVRRSECDDTCQVCKDDVMTGDVVFAFSESRIHLRCTPTRRLKSDRPRGMV